MNQKQHDGAECPKRKTGQAQKFYIILSAICLICAYTINLDELPLLPALATATLFWGGFAFAVSRVDIDELETDAEPDTEDLGTQSKKFRRTALPDMKGWLYMDPNKMRCNAAETGAKYRQIYPPALQNP